MSYLDDRPSILLERLLLIRELLNVEEFEALLDSEGLREEWERLQEHKHQRGRIFRYTGRKILGACCPEFSVSPRQEGGGCH
jgi:hypothetical protein